MKPEEHELFLTFEAFRKINISGILPNNLTQSEFAVLKAVKCCGERESQEAENAGAKMSDIIGHLKALAPSVSRSMKSLEEKGLIVRTINRRDRRNVYVALTLQGQGTLDEAEQILEEFMGTVFGNMGSDSLKRLIRYLNELRAIMSEEIKKRKYKDE